MTHRRLGWGRLGLAAVVALTVPLACGGSNSSGLFAGGGGNTHGDASTGTGGSGTGGSGTGGSGTGGSGTGGSSTGGSGTGGSGTGGSSTGGSSTGGSSTGGSGTGGSSTGGSSTGGSGTGGSSTGGSGTGGSGTGGSGTGGFGTGGAGGSATVSIHCGNSACTGPSQICCASRDGFTTPTSYSCIGAQDPCTCSNAGCMAAQLHCDGPSDCPSNEVCCGTLTNEGYSTTECAASCAGNNHVVICQPNDPVISCTGGRSCRPSQFLSGYYYCG